MEKEITKIQESVDMIAKTTAYILDNMATKEDLKNFATKKDILNLKLEIKNEIHELHTDLKSFKKDTDESVEKWKEDMVDLTDTVMLHDKSIEKLENKLV